ncbi:Pr6Pr family membrane protein [Isoptericola sp. NEAU-Y5]|uniref:Pr6Pr family membrane protein n=1 Tax=Isoptericola luteus TaxID=2879484 RepID=A0ABS7ZEJ7_9MICO|nr:Pr6Pr family membrane protein [Isoptericola sp. NEAU-Y5]MCA5893447.1 Pr6Pr family membrane protein [Isoptericola sp. NEAU-Y5]
MRRRPVAPRVLNGLLVAVIGTCFVVQIAVILAGGVDANSGQATETVATGERFRRMFSYFTIQSNVLLLASSATLALRPDRDGPVWRVLRLDAMLGIVITGLVFALVLSPDVELSGLGLWLTIGFHYAAPWIALAGWMMFGPRPRITATTVVRALEWPVAWVVYTFVQGEITGWYPYPFLDVDVVGYPAALRSVGVVLALGVLLALLLAYLDRRLPARPGGSDQGRVPRGQEVRP